ncbi:hypothetical protein [Brevibacterium daeguense]|uniref:hypothetical protein n=1 Tax=Brevibacterium daeguense TaxID=909936 RepID=UPI001F356F43|nr:hypothetical protein [Brevibacterium daeguense]
MSDDGQVEDLVEVRRRPPRAEAEQYFWDFQDSCAERLDGFLAAIAPRPEAPAYSVESLDEIEALYLERVRTPADLDDAGPRSFFFDVFRYVGEVILRTCGGEWEWEELWEQGGPGAGLPFVRVDSPEGYLRGGTVNIYTTLTGAAGTRSGHYFRDLTTAIRNSFGDAGPLRRSSGITAMGVADPAAVNPALRDYLAHHQGELERFTTALAEQGTKLDFTAESLDRLEQVLLDRYPDKADIKADFESSFVQQAARYIAEVFVRLAGGRIDIVDPAALTRRVTPEDSLPYLEHVAADGTASPALPLSQILSGAVRAKAVGRSSTVEPRTGDKIRGQLERYAASAHPNSG